MNERDPELGPKSIGGNTSLDVRAPPAKSHSFDARPAGGIAPIDKSMGGRPGCPNAWPGLVTAL